MNLKTQINSPEAETKVSADLPPEVTLYHIRVAYTFSQECYSILKMKWRYAKIYGQGAEEQPDFMNPWDVEIGIIINQIGEIEYAYKGTRQQQQALFARITRTMPDGTINRTNVQHTLPRKMRELVDMLCKHVKTTHANNVNAILSSESTSSPALNRNSWAHIVTRWIDGNKTYQALEFANGVAGLKVALCGELGFGVDLAKRAIKQLSDNKQNDATLFEWFRWEKK